jgi:hypothetical protein
MECLLEDLSMIDLDDRQTARMRFELHASPPCLRGHGIRIDSRTSFSFMHISIIVCSDQ